MQPITVQLTRPIEFKGQTLSSLSFRSPKVGDLIAASEQANPLKQTMTLLARISGLDFETFQEIEAADLQAIVEQTGDLLGNEKSPETGSA